MMYPGIGNELLEPDCMHIVTVYYSSLSNQATEEDVIQLIVFARIWCD